MQCNMETGRNPFLILLCVYDVTDNNMSLESTLCLGEDDFRHSGGRDHTVHIISSFNLK